MLCYLLLITCVFAIAAFAVSLTSFLHVQNRSVHDITTQNSEGIVTQFSTVRLSPLPSILPTTLSTISYAQPFRNPPQLFVNVETRLSGHLCASQVPEQTNRHFEILTTDCPFVGFNTQLEGTPSNEQKLQLLQVSEALPALVYVSNNNNAALYSLANTTQGTTWQSPPVTVVPSDVDQVYGLTTTSQFLPAVFASQSSTQQVLYRRANDAKFTSIASSVDLSTPNISANFLSAQVIANTNQAFVYYDTVDEKVVFVSSTDDDDDTMWNTPITLTNTMTTNIGLSLNVIQSLPSVVYGNSTQGLMFLSADNNLGSSWSNQSPISINVNAPANSQVQLHTIQIDIDIRPVVVFVDSANSNLLSFIIARDTQGNTWNNRDVVALSNHPVTSFDCQTLFSTGQLAVTFIETVSGQQLYSLINGNDPTEYTTNTLDAQNNNHDTGTSIQVIDQGVGIAFYSNNTSSNIYFVRAQPDNPELINNLDATYSATGQLL